MKNIILFVFALILISPAPKARGAEKLSHVNVTIVKITGLKNTDFGKNGLTDSYIKIYREYCALRINSSCKSWKWRYVDKTPIKHNTLTPKWNKLFKFNYSGSGSFRLRFVVWDRDKRRDKFLGVADLRSHNKGIKRLSLKMRRNFKTPAKPGSLRKPGTLILKVNPVKKKEKTIHCSVPNIVGKTEKKAKYLLNHCHNFRVYRKERLLSEREKEKDGMVISQSPKSKNWTTTHYHHYHPCGHISYTVGKRVSYKMPRVTGKSLYEAKQNLRAFRRKKINTRPGEKNPDKWFKILSQSPRAGTKIYRDSEIALYIAMPEKDFKFEVPDITGKKAREAISELRSAHLSKFKIIKHRTSEKADNSIILAQNPEGGEEIGIKQRRRFGRLTWEIEKPVTLTVGWYADGKSLYSAAPGKFEKEFELEYDKPKTEYFHIFDIKKKGYIAAELKKSGISNMVANYYKNENGTYQKANKYNLFTPSSFRVTPGKWIVAIRPEFENDTSEQKSIVKFHFIDEFDAAEPNDTFEQAVEMPLYSDLIIGFLGGRETGKDFYQFEVKDPGYIEVSYKKEPASVFYGNSKDPDIQFRLYSANKEKLGFYYPPAAPSLLMPGSYYLQLEASENHWNNTRYRFNINFHKAEDLGEPNDIKAQAYEIAVPSSIPVAYNSRGDEDYYRLTANEAGYAILSHDAALPFDTNFHSYNENSEKEKYFQNLPAAVYIEKSKLVKIKAVSDNKYVIRNLPNLNIDFIPLKEDGYEPNDDLARAAKIAAHGKTKALLIPRDDVDNYSFQVKKPCKISMGISKPCETPVKAKIFYSSGKILKDKVSFPAAINIPAKGDYILQLFQEGGFQKFCDEKYTLTIKQLRR